MYILTQICMHIKELFAHVHARSPSLCLWHSLSYSPAHSLSRSFSISLFPSLYPPPHARTSQNDINTGYKQLTCALCAPPMARETHAPRAAWVRVAESTCVMFGPQCAQLQRAYLVTLAGRV